MIVYLDESGDLGWNFSAPYRHGGSSRYLTLAALLVPASEAHLAFRLIRNLYKGFGWNAKKEKKWVDCNEQARSTFAVASRKLADAHPLIRYRSITVQKDRVLPHIRKDSNKLYNWMTKLLLLEEMARHQHVEFIPDPRSIKVINGNDLHKYLEMGIFEKQVDTTLVTCPMDSKHCLGVQFADLLAGVVQLHFEDGKSSHLLELGNAIVTERLFF